MNEQQDMDEQPKSEEIFFSAASDLPINERAAYLDQACGGDAGLRERVEALLKSHDEATSFLEPSPPKPGRTIRFELPPSEKAGDQIGHYKLLQQIGEGGCGVVYMAEQEKPVRRRVALKVIKLGMDTKSVIARFSAERQALALMDHPNIAKVLDAGATDTGRPYFVMELVRGIKITDYCDQNNLSTQARLDLFMQVCRAVQHAHQKGIIHRDIKPSNILVTMNDGVPMPKVIDFGIAKATQGKLTDDTLFTAFEQFIGTPAYMSPEQAEMSALDIDTRSDIYSLGVLLYELLTGKTPFDANELLKAGLDEMRRQIREQEPSRPSTRLSTMMAADLTTVAAHRQAQPPKLIHLVSGDLDWIVMKALEKDRTRRYETANGFAADVQRHLDNEPVSASPPGNLYKFQKFIRRNKLAFAVGTFVGISLVIGFCVIIVALFFVKQAKDDATDKLWGSYLAEARATRTSTQTGQRFASLETVMKAAAIRSNLAVRNEAIACLAVSDLRVAKETVVTGHAYNEHAIMDFNLEHYAFGETNGNITIYAASNNLVETVLPAPGYNSVRVCNFSSNGKYLCARYWREHEGDSYWVWDWEKQKVVARVFQQSDDTNAINYDFAGDFSQGSRFFAGRRSDGSISIYDLVLGKEIKRLSGTRLVDRLIFNPDCSQLACSSPDNPKVEIYDVESGKILRTVTCPVGIKEIAWSPNGKRIATAGGDFNIYIWDVESGQRQTTLVGHVGIIEHLAYNHAGNLLASSSFDGVVRLWNPNTGRQLAGYRGGGGLRFSADDRYLMGWQNIDHYGWLEVAVSRECRQLYVPRSGTFIYVPAFSSDGRIFAAGTTTIAHFWDAVSGIEIGSFPLDQLVNLIFPPDGRSLITVDRITGVQQRTFELVGASAFRLGSPHPLFEAPGIPNGSISFDGRYMAVAQQTNSQSVIFDLQNASAKVVLSGQRDVSRVALSPDGRWAATASWNNPLVKIWDARSGDLLRTITESARTWPVFSPDGRWLATSSGEYKLWDVGTWQPKSPPKPGDGNTFTAFSPDGRIMARVYMHKIQLVETATEQPLATLEAPGSITVAKLQFSPDGSRLAAVQIDQQVQLWDLRLLRQELAQMHLDWDMPPYPPVGNAAAVPVTLQIEPDLINQTVVSRESN